MGKIILASSSPRRSDILKKLDIDFEIIPSRYVEEHNAAVFSYDYVERQALGKAQEVALRIDEDTIVLGADTIVVLEDKILEKPKDKEDAFNTLKQLSGKTHFVVTSMALVSSKTKKFEVKSDTTYVTFNDLTEQMINSYIEEFNPLDKAGSYGIQELPNGFVKEIKGFMDNVIGLPSQNLKLWIEEFTKKSKQV